MNIGVVGCGRWGFNYVRIFEELPGTRVDWVHDSDEGCLKKVVQRFPTVKAASTLAEVLSSVDVQAVVVATPATSHHEVVMECLRAGKHVLVEKPLATTVRESEEMTALAESKGLVLMVGHTFLFNSGVRALKRYMEEDSFGDVYYLHSTRTNLGPIRKDVNALWDLATHDISIFNYLLDRAPEWVSSTGARLLKNGREDVAFVSLGYPGGVIANIHVSWADPFKVREVVAVGSRRRIIFNDLEGLERVKIFDKGVTPEARPDSFGEFRLLMRDGDITSPKIENSEPLKDQCLHFIDCVTTGERSISDGAVGLDVVRVMLAADESLRMQGIPIALERAERAVI